ncbi:MAG: TraG family conjugative transposon ATPase, partial [Prevotella sp.]|nr:TraG family conjugative transposon ATPase [Prevotella sp.]
MSWFLLNRNLTLLEPYDWKLSRTVLRGESSRKGADLPGKAIAKEGMADYIKYLFKTVRKFFGEAVVVTQEVDDIIHSPIVKEAIITNSDCKILLDQRKYMNKFDGIQNMLGLTDKERGQIL